MKKSICIVVERPEDGFDDNVYNIVSYISGQFQKNYLITVACIGGSSKQENERFKKYGISQLILLEIHEDFNYRSQKKYLVDFVEEVLKNSGFSLVVFMATSNGRMLAARLAIRFSCGLVAECVSIDNGEDGSFIFQRAALSGSVIAEIICTDSDIHMCTIKNVSGSLRTVEKSDNCMVKKIKRVLSDDSNFIVEEVQALEAELTNNLTTADVIIGLGSGIKRKAVIEKINYIAARLGVSIGYTRGFVELNEANRCSQIGQSGLLVSPKLYIGFGVSGATQHMVGVNNAQCIISINKDKEAPIHQYADYIIVEDAERMISQMYNAIQDK